MDTEKKYSIIGKVEIGTDEYRDLIETAKENEKSASDYMSRYWKEQSRADKAEKERDALKEGYEQFWGFISSSEEILTKYKLYLANKQLKEVKEVEKKQND